MHNHSYENEFNLHEISFSYEKEAKGNAKWPIAIHAKKDDSTTVSQPRVLFVAQYILVEGAMHSGKKAQCILVEGGMHSGKKAQCILVKSDEFENHTPFYIFVNPVYVAARPLRSLRSNKGLTRALNESDCRMF